MAAMQHRRHGQLASALIVGSLAGAAALNGQPLEVAGLPGAAKDASTGFLVHYGNGWTKGDTFGLQGGSRMYLAQDWRAPSWWGAKYARFNLLGKTLSWTVDLSNVGCGAIACLYFSAMRDPGPGPNYCDITPGAGGCVEIDVMEANRHGFEVSLHTHSGSAFDGSCNEKGCSTNVGRYPFTIERPFASPQKLYGVGAEVIDTRHPFKVTVVFAEDGAMDVHLSQGSRVLAMYNRTAAWNFNTINDVNNKAAYPEAGGIPPKDLLPAVAAMRNGMTLVSSLWSGDARWLDMTACNGQPLANLGTASFSVSGLAVRSARGTAAARGRRGEESESSDGLEAPGGKFEVLGQRLLPSTSSAWGSSMCVALPMAAALFFVEYRRRRGAAPARSLLAEDEVMEALAA